MANPSGTHCPTFSISPSISSIINTNRCVFVDNGVFLRYRLCAEMHRLLPPMGNLHGLILPPFPAYQSFPPPSQMLLSYGKCQNRVLILECQKMLPGQTEGSTAQF